MQAAGCLTSAEDGGSEQPCTNTPGATAAEGCTHMAPSVEAVLGDKDLLKSIFDQFDLQEICIAAATCQLWYEVANHDDFWKHISFRGKKVLPVNATALLRRHPRVEELDLTGIEGPGEAFNTSSFGTNGFVQNVAPHLIKLQKLTFSSSIVHGETFGPFCPIPNQLLQHLSCFSSLNCLQLTGVRMAHPVRDLAHPTLKRLILDRSDAAGVTIKCPELTHLSMAESPSTRLPSLDNVPALVSLNLSRCQKLSEASTRSILMSLTTLQELNVSGIGNFLDQTVQQLGTSLVELTQLDMSHVTGITFASVRGFPVLRRLDLSRCDQLNPGALATALESFECLESLSLDNCNLLTLELSTPKLKDLSMRGCQTLGELEVRAWQLSKLDMRPIGVPEMANHNLGKLTVTSGALKRMDWIKLNKLNQVDLDCPTLTELVVRDCDSIDASVLQSLGDTAVAPLLSSGVLEQARKSAPHVTKLTYPSSSSFGALIQPIGAGIPSHHLLWVPSEVDDDEFGIDEVLGHGDQQQPGDQQPGNDDDAGSDDDDEQGPQGGGGGAQGHRAVPSRAARAVAARMVTSRDPERLDGSWQGPERLPPELVRFGALASRPTGNRGPSSSGSTAVRSQSGVAAGASSSAAAAAAAGVAGPSGLAGGPSSHQLAGSAGDSAGASSSQAAAAARVAGPSSSAGPYRPRTGSVSDALGMGMEWLRCSRSMLQDRCFIWGTSGDRLQPIASSGQQAAQQKAAAAAAACAGPSTGAEVAPAPAADGPEPSRRRDEEGLLDFSRRKAQRLQENGARLTRALADAAGPSSSPPQQPAQTRQQQLQRRRQRLGAMGGSMTTRQQHARWRTGSEGLTLQSSQSAGAAPEAEDFDWFEDLPASIASPSASGGGLFGSQQQDRDRAQRAGLNPPSGRSLRRAGGDGGGGGGGDSSDSDADADVAGVAAAGGGPLGAPRQQRSRIASGKGGVPRLRVLHVEGCDHLQQLQLTHQALQEVVVSGCNSLVLVAIHAPKLSTLELQELGDLKGACLQEVAVCTLTMGSCSSLQGIELSSTQLVRLDVRGCGGLEQLHLNCPALQVLDANFCGSLADEGLASAVANLPPLRQLALSVCCQIGSTGLSALSRLTTLQDLDLSYTEVSTLQPILESCPHLQSLSIASCRSLGRDALLPLLDPQQPALSQLTSLDASYCDVQDHLVAQLLLKCRKLKHLALSGCAGVTDAIWEQVEAAQLQHLRQQAAAGGSTSPSAVAAAAAAAGGAALMDLDDGSQGSGGSVDPSAAQSQSGLIKAGSQLESLSLVRCSNLRSLCLGLLPASGQVDLVPSKHYLLSAADRSALQPASEDAGSWVEVPSAVSELTSLKVGLSGVQVVALALPKLSHLDLSSCKHLRVLELRCPMLLQLQLQACTSLPVVSAVRGVLGAPHLQMLDVQHMLPQASSAASGDSRDSDSGEGGSMVAEEGDVESVACGGSVGTVKEAKLLAAVATAGVLPPAVGCSAEAQIGLLLDEVAATHVGLKPAGILRCTPVCKVCQKLAQCSL